MAVDESERLELGVVVLSTLRLVYWLVMQTSALFLANPIRSLKQFPIPFTNQKFRTHS